MLKYNILTWYGQRISRFHNITAEWITYTILKDYNSFFVFTNLGYIRPSSSLYCKWSSMFRPNMSSGLEIREYDRGDPLRWPRGTVYLQKLVLTSPRGGSSVGIVHSRTKATAVLLFYSNCLGLMFTWRWPIRPKHAVRVTVMWKTWVNIKKKLHMDGQKETKLQYSIINYTESKTTLQYTVHQ
jgi:hypothetical protein